MCCLPLGSQPHSRRPSACSWRWDWQLPRIWERLLAVSLEASGPSFLSSCRKECSQSAATQKGDHGDTSHLPSEGLSLSRIKPTTTSPTQASCLMPFVCAPFGDAGLKQGLCPGDTKRRKPSPGPLPGLARRPRGEIGKV